jgi:ATP-dependent DNA helicase PIF1
MTINKSQGQSLNQVGVYLESQICMHGQLYEAFSRGKHPDKIIVLTGSNEHNVRNVFLEVIQIKQLSLTLQKLRSRASVNY